MTRLRLVTGSAVLHRTLLRCGTRCCDTRCCDTRYCCARCCDTRCCNTRCCCARYCDTRYCDTRCSDTPLLHTTPSPLTILSNPLLPYSNLITLKEMTKSASQFRIHAPKTLFCITFSNLKHDIYNTVILIPNTTNIVA